MTAHDHPWPNQPPSTNTTNHQPTTNSPPPSASVHFSLLGFRFLRLLRALLRVQAAQLGDHVGHCLVRLLSGTGGSTGGTLNNDGK